MTPQPSTGHTRGEEAWLGERLASLRMDRSCATSCMGGTGEVAALEVVRLGWQRCWWVSRAGRVSNVSTQEEQM